MSDGNECQQCRRSFANCKCDISQELYGVAIQRDTLERLRRILGEHQAELVRAKRKSHTPLIAIRLEKCIAECELDAKRIDVALGIKS